MVGFTNARQKNGIALWINATQYRETGVSFIFLIGSISEFCKNKRRWDLGGEFRIFMSYGQW